MSSPLSIHHVWHADQMDAATPRTLATGYTLLDAELPGAGWPVSSLIELLPQHPGIGELRLCNDPLKTCTGHNFERNMT